MIRFGNGRPRNRVSILEMVKTSSATCVSYKGDTVKLNHSLSSIAEVESVRLYLHSPLHSLMAWCLVKQKDEFNFLFLKIFTTDMLGASTV